MKMNDSAAKPESIGAVLRRHEKEREAAIQRTRQEGSRVAEETLLAIQKDTNERIATITDQARKIALREGTDLKAIPKIPHDSEALAEIARRNPDEVPMLFYFEPRPYAGTWRRRAWVLIDVSKEAFNT